MPADTLTSPHLTPPPTRRQRRDRFRGDIEGLRAVAVVLVVAYHAGVGAVGGGFVGVDVFFVLSGFLITGLLLDEIARTGSISIRDFYARRVRRLLPLSALVLTTTAVAAALLVPPIDRPGVAGDIAGAAVWGANWKFAAESTQYMADTDQSLVLHFWSLAVEEQFYVVWPLLLLVLVGSSGLALRAWPVAFRRISIGLTVIVVGSLTLSWLQTNAASPFAYFGLHTRSWELGIGAGLALLRPALPLMTRGAAQAAALLGALMVVGAAVGMDETTPFPGTAALVPVLGTALIVGAGARLPDGVVARSLSGGATRYVGRISYSWYLWHWPVLVLAAARWGESTAGDGGAASNVTVHWSVTLAAVGVSFVLAAASHHAVEQPLRQARLLRVSRGRSLAVGGLLVAVSLVASVGLLLSATSVDDEEAVSIPRASTGPPRDAANSETEGTPQSVVADEAALREPNTPEDARADRPALGSCYVGYRPTEVPPAGECRVGPARGAERTVALIGDSHAAAWYPGFRRVAEERGWTLYFFGKAACSVIDVELRKTDSDERYDACSTWRASVYDRLEEIPGLDAVAIGRWKGYTSTVLHPDGSTSSPSTVGPIWAAGVERTVDRLRRSTDRVIVMEDVPWPLVDVPSCLSENPKDVEECSFPRSKRSGLDAALVTAEKSVASEAVRFVQMTDVICPDSTCQVVSSTGQIMFRDHHHLTEGFSATLWPELGDRLEAVVDS